MTQAIVLFSGEKIVSGIPPRPTQGIEFALPQKGKNGPVMHYFINMWDIFLETHTSCNWNLLD